MMRAICLCLALITLAACRSDDPITRAETSPGGLDYTLIVLPDQQDVSIQVAWPTDWAYRAQTAKAALLVGTQLILAGGAEGFAAGEAAERFADLNSEGYIYSSFTDHVIGELTFERAHLDETVEIARAHLVAPDLDAMWFERIRDGIAQNMAETQAQPGDAGFDAVRWAVFGTQPLRNALSFDAPGTFSAVTRADIVAWHAATFTRSPEAIVVAGGIDAAAAGRAIDRLLGDLPMGQGMQPREARPDFAPRRILLHLPQAGTSTLSLIAPLPPTRLGGEFEDLLLVAALGGDDQSVLFEAVRTELRASYGFGAGFANYTRENRILFLSGEVETAQLAEVERVVREAYDAFRAQGPGDDLAARKRAIEASLRDLPDHVVDLARSELQSALDGFAPGRALALGAELSAVTGEGLRARLAGSFPQAGAFVVLAVSPDAQALPGACVITAPQEAADCP